MRGRETGTGASCKSLLCQCTRCLARRPPPFPGPFLPLQRCSAVTASAAQKTSLSHRCDRDGVAEQRAHGSSRWASPREVGIQSPRNVRQSRLPGSTWRHSIVWQKNKKQCLRISSPRNPFQSQVLAFGPQKCSDSRAESLQRSSRRCSQCHRELSKLPKPKEKH